MKPGDDRLISPEFVDRLRAMGSTNDLIEFTERHVARYSQADLDRSFREGFLIAVGLIGVLFIIVMNWPR